MDILQAPKDRCDTKLRRQLPKSIFAGAIVVQIAERFAGRANT